MATILEALAIGLQHHRAGQLDAAAQIYRQVLDIEPNQADALHLLGEIAHQLGQQEAAIEYIERAIRLNGTAAAYHNNLGQAYRASRKSAEAVACYRRALELRPDLVEAHTNLGIVLQQQGKMEEAIACYCRALEMQSDYAEAHMSLGSALQENGLLDDAIACHRRTLQLRPEYALAYNNLGNALTAQGKLEEAVVCFRRALELEPGLAVAHSNLLLTLHYCTGITLAELAEAHAAYGRQHAHLLHSGTSSPKVSKTCRDRLRLGFVSPDLGSHPVGYFLIRVLENLSSGDHETICYSDRVVKDKLTDRLQAAATGWRDVNGLDDELLAEQIRADEIDILFDLSGHTARNRLLVFARKPAPVQITWIGYEGTTGLAAMDYLLADRHMVPAGNEIFYGEQVLRMPDGYLCYDPPVAAPPVGPVPAMRKGYVTFGSFNNPAKITTEVVAVWAEILRRVPNSRLMFKFRGMGDESVQRRYGDLFVSHHVDLGRVEFLPPSSYDEYLTAYDEVDVMLDPFPFSGSATTCDALWMGVPVVTCPGETFASRHSLSHLSNIGLTETVASDLNQYVGLAVAMASDLPRLAAIRASLRGRMADSPLCDGPRFAKNLTALLRSVWQKRIRSAE